MTKFIQFTILVNEFTFKYTNFFGKVKTKTIDCNCCPSWRTVQSKVIEEEEKESMFDDFKKSVFTHYINSLALEYKNSELLDIKYSTTEKDVTKQTVEWCLQNLTIEQLVKIGLTIVNSEDL